MIAINKHSKNLKDWSVEMPNAPYSNRYAQGNKIIFTYLKEKIMNKFKMLNYYRLFMISLIFIILNSCSSKPDYPKTFGVYLLNDNEYIAIKRQETYSTNNDWGKPTAGELGIKSTRQLFRDSRFGKNHIYKTYSVRAKGSPYINVNEFNENGIIIIGESITNCEIIFVPDSVWIFNNALSNSIVYRVNDSWGEKSFNATQKYELDQIKLDENTYQIIPAVNIPEGIYLFNYKTYGNNSDNGFNPIYLKSTKQLEELKNLMKKDNKKIETFFKESKNEYILKDGFHYFIHKNGSGQLINTQQKIKYEYSVSLLDNTKISSGEGSFSRWSWGGLVNRIPYVSEGVDGDEFTKLIGNFQLGTEVSIIIPSELLGYQKTGFELPTHLPSSTL